MKIDTIPPSQAAIDTEPSEVEHRQFPDVYRDEPEFDSDSCISVAISLAELLKKEGKTAQILSIKNAHVDASGKRGLLMPKPHEGRVSWGAHAICVAEDIAYDPMLDAPTPLDKYLTSVFDEEVELANISHLLDR